MIEQMMQTFWLVAEKIASGFLLDVIVLILLMSMIAMILFGRR